MTRYRWECATEELGAGGSPAQSALHVLAGKLDLQEPGNIRRRERYSPEQQDKRVSGPFRAGREF